MHHFYCDGFSWRILLDELNIKKIILKQSKQISVKLDTKLTPELEFEGYAREMSRQIQAFRKKLGLKKKDKVDFLPFIFYLFIFVFNLFNTLSTAFFPVNMAMGKPAGL